MRAQLITLVSLGAILAGCSAERANHEQSKVDSPTKTPLAKAIARAGGSSIASLPDSGALLRYDDNVPVRREGATTWHAVQLSEAHALRASVEGEMVVPSPTGEQMRLKFERRVEGADGNWSWIGRRVGSKGGPVVLTFGEKAVFGRIPNGDEMPLSVTTQAGRTWLGETDKRKMPVFEPQGADYAEAMTLRENTLGASSAAASKTAAPKTAAAGKSVAAAGMGAASLAAAAAAPNAIEASTIDVVFGYTPGYATRWGGAAGAVTRLNFLITLTNQAYIDSQVSGQIRMVRSVQVNYTETNANQTALFQLTGVSCANSFDGPIRLPDTGSTCSRTATNAALQPLIAAREQFGADVVALVRNFQTPSQGSCGISWLNGGVQRPILLSSSDWGFAIVSDSGDNGVTCREEALAHELGHTMGLAHDRLTATHNNDTNSDGNMLDPEEFGRFPYSFGHQADAANGNFYTIMALRRPNQSGELVFSNPRISTCGANNATLPCGVVDQADDSRALALTMPVVAGFRMPLAQLPNVFLRGDFDADGRSDIIWRNRVTGANTMWRAANAPQQLLMSPVADRNWSIAGVGDFNADGRSDVVWRNGVTGANVLWRSALSSQQQTLSPVAADWVVAAIGDFEGDNRSDILWRNEATGANVIWRNGVSSTQFARPAVPVAWRVVGAGDFDGDGRDDVLWRNQVTGQNTIWRSANNATATALTAVVNLAWRPAGVGDFDGDGKADIFWHSGVTGQNTLWRSGASANLTTLTTVADVRWVPVAVGDFDNDGKDDILWRNFSTGANVIWRSAASSLQLPRATVNDPIWQISG